ncbi:hypothetical protein MMC10_006381 [Thelotrema lepadinum]|nr:hypothetical protein [Thelotrema lepadinum]
MADVQQRPSAPRGRGSGRGGRGGYSSRGGRPRQANGNKSESNPVTSTYEEEGEIGQLKKKYAANLGQIKEMFPDWTDDDIVFALEENGNDVERTVERMSEGNDISAKQNLQRRGCANACIGNVSQWGEVKKKSKDKVSGKTKEPATDGAEAPSRGGRGARGAEGHRGGRGRATERGRGGGRGRARDGTASRKPATTNESINEAPAVPISDTWDTPAEVTSSTDNWEQAAQTIAPSDDNSWEVITPVDAVPSPAPEQPQPSAKPDGTRTWASMLKPAAKPKPAVPTPKVVPTAPAPTQETIAPEVSTEPQVPEEDTPTASLHPHEPRVEGLTATASPILPPSEPALELTPSKDQLTESNLEQVEDISEPPATITVASTAGGTNDPRSAAGSVTPAHAMQHQATLRPGLGGYQTTALKATSASGRTSSFTRRVKEQQEAVVMPGNHAVDRAAVQFGSLGLGGSPEDLDVDDDREEPETRTQPPQHSPVAPKAALPPVPQQPTEILRAAPGLPPPTQPGPGSQPAEQNSSPLGAQGGYGYNQFSNLYGAAASQNNESSFAAPKAYEQFGQPTSHASHQAQNGFPHHSQAPGQPSQLAHQSHLGGFSTAASEYASYYTSDQARNAYQNAYAAYGQQPQAPQEIGGAQQKLGNVLITSAADHPSQTAPSQGTHPSQARFGTTEAQNSGHSTPNPAPGQPGQAPAQQAHQMGQAHGQSQQYAGYPYGGSYYGNYYHPGFMSQHAYGPERGPYDDIRRYEADQHMSQQTQHFGYGANQGRYGGGPYGAAGGKYGQPHQNYGMTPQAWDAHSASPANVGAYSQQAHSMSARDMSSSLGSYGRAGSTQPSEGQQQHGTGSFGGMTDPFGSRSQSTFTQPSSQQSGAQQSGNEDQTRGFTETSKITGGPSPVPGQTTVGRPTSATNVQGQTSQSQTQQSYAGYPQLGSQVHGQQSQYGSGIGGLGHQHPGQTHQSGYGGYGAFGGNYYGNNSRSGW